MKSCLVLLLLLPAAGELALAQNPRPKPVVSPEINDDRGVTFRFNGPNAKEVSLRGQWSRSPIPMTRGEDGVWSVTSVDIHPGVWEYAFSVDGLSLLDPKNPSLKPQREPQRSILHIPGSPPNPWDFQDVPHGAVHQHSYLSKALGRQRELWIYTPPGYEVETSHKYPLLILQHGSGDNHKTWVEHGKAHWIVDNLIATEKAKPMIVLMLDGHPLGQVPREAGDRRVSSLAAFERELFDDALPLVESRYRIAPGRENRAIAGLSMGGGQSLNIGLNHLDRFAWIGSFSGAADQTTLKAALDDASGTNQQLKLLWIACGKSDSLLARNETLIATLKQSGIRHEWLLTEGDHSWPVWRGYLTDFVPRLFR